MSSTKTLHTIIRSHRHYILNVKSLMSLNALNLPRFKSDKTQKGTEISSTTILMQDGIHVQELPLIVKKVKDLPIFEDKDIKISKTEEDIDTQNRIRAAIFSCADAEIHKLIRHEFSQCVTVNAVETILSKCSSITCNIALGALERIYKINNSRKSTIRLDCDGDDTISDQISSLLDKLFRIVLKDENVSSLLRALKIIPFNDDIYINILCDEILERVSDGKLTPFEICEVVNFFKANRHIEKLSDSTEKLWVGLIDREKELDEHTMVKCFGIIHHLQESKKVVVHLLEKRVMQLWWKMKPDTVTEIMKSLSQNNMTSSRILPIIGRWTNTNIHTISEDTLLEIVTQFYQLKYTDLQIEKALERYIKLKGMKIKSHALVIAIMNFFCNFRSRNPYILNGCSEYFIANGEDMNPMFIRSLIYPYGHLNYQPSNGMKFWKVLEDVLDTKFQKINTEDILDIMASCVYLQKYPLNFVSKIFNPFFFEKINSMPNSQSLQSKLKMLDAALTLECKAYTGPFLPKDLGPKSFWYDNRIKRLVNNIRESFELIAGGADCMSTTVAIPGMCISDLYIVDVMLHPKGLRSSLLNSSYYKDRNINVALLINLPEHFTSNNETLIGSQEMRIRHLRLLGLKVVNLKYDILSRFRMHRKELEKYLISKLKEAQNAF